MLLVATKKKYSTLNALEQTAVSNILNKALCPEQGMIAVQYFLVRSQKVYQLAYRLVKTTGVCLSHLTQVFGKKKVTL